jgi:hypothetical protein
LPSFSLNIENIRALEFIDFSVKELTRLIKKVENENQDAAISRKQYESLNIKDESFDEYKSFMSKASPWYTVKHLTRAFQKQEEPKMILKFPRIFKWFQATREKEFFIIYPLAIKAIEQCLAKHSAGHFKLSDSMVKRFIYEKENYETVFNNQLKKFEQEFNILRQKRIHSINSKNLKWLCLYLILSTHIMKI